MPVRETVARLLTRLSSVARPANDRGEEAFGPSSSRGPISSVPAFLPPRFRVKEKLGQGGMGIVYRAYDSELGRDVAVKALTRINPDDLYHLKNEFRALTQIRHPNLVDLYELTVDDRGSFFSMELVTGTDFVGFVRSRDGGKEKCDYDRLRDAAHQLALAISAVHAAGKLHRDIKPSNIRVSNSARVVLLDFGLADPLSPDAVETRATGALIGTVEYMPPEQARGDALGPAADWYGFGATLFEAIAGRLPLEQPLKWLLGGRTATGPPSLASIVPDVPSDLNELVAQLLNPDPKARPSGRDVLAAISRAGATPSYSQAPSSRAQSPVPFENREDELNSLTVALERTRTGSTAIAHVFGTSGIGKTELVRRFTHQAERAGALVLRGRCHPQESVTFNAIDGAVDDLSHLLDRIPREQVVALLPKNAAVMPRLFPVLGRIADIVEADYSQIDETAQETLRRATRALKELLATLADRQPVVVWLDDVQWSDRDSGILLRDLLSPPAPPNMLVVLSYRAEDRESSQLLAAVKGMDHIGAIELGLEPLTTSQTVNLVGRLLGTGWEGDTADIVRLAREAEGLPFFAHELARYLSRPTVEDESVPSSLRLADLLRQRIRELPADARSVLEVVSVAGGPLELPLIFRAITVRDTPKSILATLERSSLIRSTTTASESSSEIYHHRIREVVLAGLEKDARERYHRAIANAMLTATSPNLPRVIEHYDAAGDLDSVRKYLASAAKSAASVLAFDRAALLYRRAIELGSTELSPPELHARLAEVLANAGRGRDSGRTFERAAELSEEAGEGLERSLFLRKRAAEQYLQSGQWADAARALERVLAPLSIQLPPSSATALYHTAVNRVRIAARGLTFRGVESRAVAPLTLDRLEMLHTLVLVYSYQDFMRGAAFASQLLADALEFGNADMIMRGLSAECGNWATMPGRFSRRMSRRMLASFEKLLPQGGPYHRGGYLQTTAAACWLRGEFADTVKYFREAEPVIREGGKNVAFLLATAKAFCLPSLAHLGEVRELIKELGAAIADAEARGDDYFLCIGVNGHQSLAWLAQDLPQEALRYADRAREILPEGFVVPDYMNFLTRVLVDLYIGRGEEALARVESTWPALRRGMMLSIPYFGEDLHQLRARAMLTVAAKKSAAGERDDAAHLLAMARAAAKVLDGMIEPSARGHAELVRAGIARIRGDKKDAMAALERAVPILERAQLNLYAQAARLSLAELSGSPTTADRVEAWMKDQGIVKPRAIVRLLVPGTLP